MYLENTILNIKNSVAELKKLPKLEPIQKQTNLKIPLFQIRQQQSELIKKILPYISEIYTFVLSNQQSFLQNESLNSQTEERIESATKSINIIKENLKNNGIYDFELFMELIEQKNELSNQVIETFSKEKIDKLLNEVKPTTCDDELCGFISETLLKDFKGPSKKRLEVLNILVAFIDKVKSS